MLYFWNRLVHRLSFNAVEPCHVQKVSHRVCNSLDAHHRALRRDGSGRCRHRHRNDRDDAQRGLPLELPLVGVVFLGDLVRRCWLLHGQQLQDHGVRVGWHRMVDGLDSQHRGRRQGAEFGVVPVGNVMHRCRVPHQRSSSDVGERLEWFVVDDDHQPQQRCFGQRVEIGVMRFDNVLRCGWQIFG